MCKFYQVMVEGILECQTDVHVGDGEDEVIEKERFRVPGKPDRKPRNGKDLIDNTTHYNTCVSRSSGELVLPGSTLRGSLRSSLSGAGNKTIRESLFGPDKIGEGGQRGGIVRVDDAFRESYGDESQVRYWHPGRKTGLRIGIGIDPVTEAVRPKELFYYEIYPEGTRFNISLTMDWVDQKDIGNLKTALQCWNGNISGNLGSHKSKSWGVMKWDSYTISVIETEAVREWLESPDNEPIKEPIRKTVHEIIDAKQILPVNRDIALTLTTLQPLLVDDPGRVLEKENKDERPPNKETYRTTRGEFAIPAESFAGACRGEARRIVASLVYQKKKNHQFASKLAKEMIDDLFGGTSQGSRIQFSDFVHKGTLDPHEQWFNAIDRFTGGVAESEAGGKLYNVVAIRPKTGLKCDGIGFPRGLEPWQAGLLYLVFRELHAKRFWLGGFRAKGYGLVGLEGASFGHLKKDLVAKAKKKTVQETLTALQEEVKKRVKESECEDEQPLSKTIYGSPDTNSSTGGNGERDSTSGKQLNPYAFVPVKALWNGSNCPKYDEIKEKGIRHDLYIPERHTGIITCTLETVTDTLVGNRHEQPDKEEETTVYPYPHAGRVAFPANSLRGMIGNVIEILSQSSLRVLEDKYLSIRKLPGKNRPFKTGKYPLLSAIGRVTKQDGDWYIEPLTLPHLRSDGGTVQVNNIWKLAFSGIPFRECLSAYINKSQATSYGPGNQDIYKVTTEFNSNVIVEGEPKLTDRTVGLKKKYLILGQCVAPNSLAKYEIGGADLKSGEIIGYIRVLAENGHEFPSNRTHELFIPKPITRRTLIRVPSETKDKFDRLCKQAISAKVGVDRLDEQAAGSSEVEKLVMPTGYTSHQLRENMLLCFDVASVDNKLEVSEISFSSIWREQFEPETTYKAFAKIDNNLLPWGALPSRNWLTPAEAMLGIVEERDGVAGQKNLASRLRFTDGLFLGDGEPNQTDDKVILKILASPKPPSPNLYFHNASTNVRPNLFPNGRKIYLRHHSDRVDPEYYRTKDESENRKQKVVCQPITEGQKFTFDIHYHNLDDDEKKLLLTAIEPGNEFRHKLGLGKPLGMGSVEIKVKCIKERNIKECFTRVDSIATEDKSIGDFIVDSDDHGRMVDPDTLKCLQQIGKQRNKNELITYPLTKAQVAALGFDSEKRIRAWAERELFRWHANNTGKKTPATLWGSCGAFNIDNDINNGQLMFGVLEVEAQSSGKSLPGNPNWVIKYKKKNKCMKLIGDKDFHDKEDKKNLYEDIKTKVEALDAGKKYQVLFVYEEVTPKQPGKGCRVTLLEVL